MKTISNEKNFITTRNSTGFISGTIDTISQEFIDYAILHSANVLEVGAGFGIILEQLVEHSVTMTANDVDKSHLEVIQQKLESYINKNLFLNHAQFPEQFQTEPNRYDAVLSARTIHLFNGEQLVKSFNTFFRILKPNGKLFITCDSLYLNNWITFLPEYRKRVEHGVQWPGFVANPECFVDNYNDNWPPYIHILEPHDLKKLAVDAGLSVEKCGYMSRKDYPADRQLDGRENVYLVANKNFGR